MRRAIAPWMCLLLLAPAGVCAQALELLYNPHAAYHYAAANGQVQGLLVDRINAALQSTDIQVVWREVPVARQRDELRRNERAACVVGALKTPERVGLGKFSAPFYRAMPIVAISLADNPRMVSGRPLRQTLEDPQLTLLAKDGYTFGAYVTAQVERSRPKTMRTLTKYRIWWPCWAASVPTICSWPRMLSRRWYAASAIRPAASRSPTSAICRKETIAICGAASRCRTPCWRSSTGPSPGCPRGCRRAEAARHASAAMDDGGLLEGAGYAHLLGGRHVVRRRHAGLGRRRRAAAVWSARRRRGRGRRQWTGQAHGDGRQQFAHGPDHPRHAGARPSGDRRPRLEHPGRQRRGQHAGLPQQLCRPGGRLRHRGRRSARLRRADRRAGLHGDAERHQPGGARRRRDDRGQLSEPAQPRQQRGRLHESGVRRLHAARPLQPSTPQTDPGYLAGGPLPPRLGQSDLSLGYEGGPVTASLAYARDDRQGGPQPQDFRAKWQASGSYALPAVRLYAMAGDDRYQNTPATRSHVRYWLTGFSLPVSDLMQLTVNGMRRPLQNELRGGTANVQGGVVYFFSVRVRGFLVCDRLVADDHLAGGITRTVSTGLQYRF